MGSMHLDLLKDEPKLLVTRYKEQWVVPGAQEEEQTTGSDDFSTNGSEQTTVSKQQTSKGPPALCRPNSVSKRKQTTQRCPLPFTRAEKADDTLQQADDMATGASFSKLDVDTLHRIGWAQDTNGTREQNGFSLEDDEDSIYKITKVEFKRLSEQVRDVSMNLKNKFRPSAYQKLYNTGRPESGRGRGEGGGGGTGDSVTQVYHSQLAASLKAFQQKQWRPLKQDEIEPTVTRCRPISGRADRRSGTSRPSSAVPTPPSRPRSVPPGMYRPSSAFRRTETPEVGQGNFDTLSPKVLADLLGTSSIQPRSFGDRLPQRRGREKTDRREERDRRDERARRDKRERERRDEELSTSGIDSAISDEEDSSDSESETEPPLDRNRPVPSLELRPERLDSIYVPEDRKDRRRFDFDAENVDIPLYEFDSAIPEPFCRLDLKVIARQKYNWRDILSVRPNNKTIETIIDRLVEIERLQSETVEWEGKRLRQRAKQRVSSAKPRDKRCCSNCLQPACVGDCPEKSLLTNTCTLCRQQLCSGSCAETKYDAYMRQTYQLEEMEDFLNNPVPRICITCQKKHNAKLINANNAILRRPKSGNTTYSRGKASAKPRDLRPRSVTDINNEIVQDIEKLGLDPIQCRPNTGKFQRPRSRNAILPGKSYFSNRKESLTELDKAKKRKLRSLRVKRPKSVV